MTFRSGSGDASDVSQCILCFAVLVAILTYIFSSTVHQSVQQTYHSIVNENDQRSRPWSSSISSKSSPQFRSPPRTTRSSFAKLYLQFRAIIFHSTRVLFAFLLLPPGTHSSLPLSLVRRCLTLCLMIYEILQSAHRPSDSRWRLIFSLSISTFSALGVSHVMCSINVRYLLTYLLTYRMSVIVHHLLVFRNRLKTHYFSSAFSALWHLTHMCLDSNLTLALYKSFRPTYLLT